MEWEYLVEMYIQYGECNGGDVRGMERGANIVGYVRGVYSGESTVNEM